MNVPYRQQLAQKQSELKESLGRLLPTDRWLPAQASRESGFRNKAKMVVGGTRGDVRLGVLGPDGDVADLRHCSLHEPGLAAALPVLGEELNAAGLVPYDVGARRGEAKYALLTHSPDGELMVRLVLRSPGQVNRVRELIPRLRTALPGVRVVSMNLQPEHKAVLEGPQEVMLTEQQTLPMRVNDITLHLRTGSFFQTNTEVAAALYRQASDWIDEGLSRSGGARVWDLYCGVGGFALHAAAPQREVLGVELSAEAVASARRSAAEIGDHAHFIAEDVSAFLSGAGLSHPAPDVVVVNPPRRGLSASLSAWLEKSDVPEVIYSSCSATSLARDLERMPSLGVVAARLFDMFPQTGHHEILVRLSRER